MASPGRCACTSATSASAWTISPIDEGRTTSTALLLWRPTQQRNHVECAHRQSREAGRRSAYTRRMPGPLPLSLCVITRNAGTQLAGCLASAPFAGEIIVIDSGSSDDTVEI